MMLKMEPIPWSKGLTLLKKEHGYPKRRAIVRAMQAHPGFQHLVRATYRKAKNGRKGRR
ncbi:MAG: hypothetical protein KAU14_09615 [Thermoplasmata archaeon]|nr:hypothetical protein [Thermoplasmata archaeon]